MKFYEYRLLGLFLTGPQDYLPMTEYVAAPQAGRAMQSLSCIADRYP